MKIKLTLSILISVAFVGFLFYFIPYEEIISSVASISPLALAYAFAYYLLSQLIRSLRWFLLLPELNFSLAFLINSANILLNNVIPARAGELSWFYYTKTRGISLKDSLWVFFVARLYDLLGLVALFFTYLSYLKGGLFILSLSLILSLLVAMLFPVSFKLIPPVGRLKSIKDFLSQKHTLRVSLILITTSLFSFFFKFLSLYFVVLELSKMSFITAMLAFAGGDITTILPVHSFMGYGTYEGGFLLPLKALGIEIQEGLKLGFITHNFLILSSILLGIPSLIFLHFKGKVY